MRYSLKFTPAFRFFMAKVVTDWAFYFIFNKRKVIIGNFLDPYHIPLISCFSSHDGFVSNTLSSFVSKKMTWEKFPIKEVPATIESIDLVIVASIDIHLWSKLSMIYLRLVLASVHPWSKLSLIYLVICFMPFLTIVILFTVLCCIKIAFSGGWWILWLRCFFNISKIYKNQRLWQWRRWGLFSHIKSHWFWRRNQWL